MPRKCCVPDPKSAEHVCWGILQQRNRHAAEKNLGTGSPRLVLSLLCVRLRGRFLQDQANPGGGDNEDWDD